MLLVLDKKEYLNKLNYIYLENWTWTAAVVNNEYTQTI